MKDIAQKILDRAADGERNSDHLRQAALDHFANRRQPLSLLTAVAICFGSYSLRYGSKDRRSKL
jgi:hypothetical protein